MYLCQPALVYAELKSVCESTELQHIQFRVWAGDLRPTFKQPPHRLAHR